MAEPDISAEIGQLLDQCSPEELENILREIEGNPSKEPTVSEFEIPREVLQARGQRSTSTGEGTVPMPKNVDGAEVLSFESRPNTSAADMTPVPPSAPRPESGSRRPVPANMKPATPLTVSQMQELLAQHTSSMLAEVRKTILEETAPKAPAGTSQHSDVVDLDTLTRVLVERDREALRLEARLAELQGVLAEKDKHVVELGEELDNAVRDVRHRRLDLEFQQLKLEERVRTNNEMEQAQRILAMRKEEASQTARHAEIDIEAHRTSPRSVRLQGTLPYALRKGGLY